MEEGMNIWNRCFERVGLKINGEKTVMMNVKRERREEDLEVMIEGRRIETVESFKYLVSVFCREGGTEGDINERITKFGRCTNLFSPLLRDTAIQLGVKR